MKNKRSKSIRLIIWASLWLAQIIAFYLLSINNKTVLCFSQFFDWQKKVHQALFEIVSFSVGDILYFIAILWIVRLLFLIFIKRRKTLLIPLLITINILYLVYQLTWGILYFQPPIIQITSEKEINIERLKMLSTHYLNRCIALREGSSEDENGVFQLSNLTKVKKTIINTQHKIPVQYNKSKTTGIVSIKPSLYSSILSYTGIYGYYNPFSAEAQYDENIPDSTKAFTLSHEAAHQLGYAREQEASFIGFLTCIYSQDQDLQYSANLYALKSLLRAVNDIDPEWVSQLKQNYSSKMKTDQAYELSFRKSHDGLLTQFFSWSNDLFLKSNRQEGSITYNYFLELLLAYEA